MALERPTTTVEEAAKLLGIGRNQAYEAVKRKEIPSVTIGRRILIPTAALRRMLAIEANSASDAA